MTDSSQEIQHLVIPHDKVPTAAYQAIYHKLTDRVETTTKSFDDAFYIKPENLEQLDHRLRQAIKPFPVKGQDSTISVSMKDSETLRFSSIEKFARNSFVQNVPTSQIVYKFNFFCVLPVEIEEA